MLKSAVHFYSASVRSPFPLPSSCSTMWSDTSLYSRNDSLALLHEPPGRLRSSYGHYQEAGGRSDHQHDKVYRTCTSLHPALQLPRARSQILREQELALLWCRVSVSNNLLYPPSCLTFFVLYLVWRPTSACTNTNHFQRRQKALSARR